MRQLEYIQLLYAFHFHFLPKNEHETRPRFFRVCLCFRDAPKITGCDSTMVQNRLYPVCLFPRADLLASVWTRKLSPVLRHRITGDHACTLAGEPATREHDGGRGTLPELAWNLDFFVRLTTGATFMGLSGYMFDRNIPLLFIIPRGAATVSSGCFTGSVTMSALSSRKRLSQPLYCRSRISSATRSGISIAFTGLVRGRRLESPRFGSWHF